tara:strand:+ start:139 stop:1281 length:1143 start_codon:yes stop_codon:yes gene_type:complete
MLKLYLNVIIASLFLLSGCASTSPSSMEFRSAKTSARSEKNLKKAEEWAVKALDMEIHATDASVPYFLAIEIYKPQKRWVEMAEMLDEAILRNPEQKLDEPKYLRDPKEITKENIKESIAFTIEEAVNAYRKELWVNLYNGALDSYEKGNKEEAIQKFKLALDVDPKKHATYIVLAKFYKEENNLEASNEMISAALSMESLTSDDKTELLLIKAEILKQQENWDEAMEYYEKAFTESDNESMAALLSILEINLMSENYLNAIEWGEKAMAKRSKIDRMYFSHLLYNIGLSYRGAGSLYYDKAVDIITQINNGEEISLSTKKDGINNLKIANDYFSEGRLYFLDASVEGMDDAQERANQIRDIIEQANEIYIPFLDEYTPK